ncbi:MULTISPECIES: glycosyl hydrolase family 28-related protein [Staphylococcus]|uniref:Glycosyl hydrolase family 28-related protein n=1 Tax=Staphylococcus hsinchuensis TaxID=3051183 RepID=A0ABZ3EGV2_9STAP|nr:MULTISPECIES: glycosyl hydrolase family 28-related protein [unclassified Staphylococcus]
MMINAKEFGLKGKNKRADTRALQRALNYAKKHGNTEIYIPAGEYHIRKALVIYARTSLILDDNAVLKRCGKDALLKNGTKLKRYYGYDGNGHIRISGGTFDMNGEAYPYNNTAMSIGHAREIEIRNVTFKDIVGGHAIDACGLNGLYMGGCQFLGFNNPQGDRSFSEAIQIDLQVKGAFPKFGAADGTITKNVIIEHCYFGNSDTPTMQPWNRAIGSHASRFNQFYDNIHIRHNTFEGMGYYALTPLKSTNMYIYDNHFINCNGGIRYLAVKEGKNARDLKGKERSTQAGKHLYIYNNDFEGHMKKDAVHIQSYNCVKHQDIVIADNHFNDESQSLFLNNIQGLVLDVPDNTKIKATQLININE